MSLEVRKAMGSLPDPRRQKDHGRGKIHLFILLIFQSTSSSISRRGSGNVSKRDIDVHPVTNIETGLAPFGICFCCWILVEMSMSLLLGIWFVTLLQVVVLLKEMSPCVHYHRSLASCAAATLAIHKKMENKQYGLVYRVCNLENRLVVERPTVVVSN